MCAFAFWPSYDVFTELRNKKANIQEEPRVDPTCDGARKCQMHPHSLWWWQNVVNTCLRYRTTQASGTAEKSFKSRSKFEPDSQLCSAQMWWWWWGEGAWGNISPSKHCSAQSVITGAAVKFTFYIWMNYRWLVTSAALNECSRQNANVAADTGLCERLHSISKTQVFFFSKWNKALEFLTHCFQSKFRSIDGHHDLFFYCKMNWK